MAYLDLRAKRRAWGKTYRDRKKRGETVPKKAPNPDAQPAVVSASSNAAVAEYSARTPTYILYADGCRWDGMMSARMDQALADHRREHGRGSR